MKKSKPVRLAFSFFYEYSIIYDTPFSLACTDFTFCDIRHEPASVWSMVIFTHSSLRICLPFKNTGGSIFLLNEWAGYRQRPGQIPLLLEIAGQLLGIDIDGGVRR
jgi:hypothetical protein